jgi:isopentenyl-diphosphate delta-isomerase
MDIRSRKQDHVDLTLDGGSDHAMSAGFDRYALWHEALPELDYDDTDASATLLGRTFSLPLFISSMTGGFEGALDVNRMLALVAETRNLPMGVGSQRAMLTDSAVEPTFRIVRQTAPNAFIAANIGGVQLAAGWSEDRTRRIVDVIRADAIIVHLNPAQEMVQPEGDRRFKGVLAGIGHLVRTCGVPVIVKETGAGISHSTARRLKDVGVSVLDVAGAGGTSWTKVEARRRADQDHSFDEWGIPTVDSIRAVAPLASDSFRIIASGGIRSETDIAKAVCLGADMAAMAQPFLSRVKEGGDEAVLRWLDDLERRLRTVLLLTGCRTIRDWSLAHLRTL